MVEKFHLPAIRGVPELLPAIVVDANAERAQRFAERYNFPRWSSDLRDLEVGVDVVLVALPNNLHAKVSNALLERGIHVLCEKPMARNVEECRSMIDAARRGQAQLAIGHNRRFKAHIQLAKRLLEKGLIGEVSEVYAEEGSASDWRRSGAYFDRTQSGGGSLMDVGIHAIDLIRWIAGEFDKIEYSGDGTENTVESEAEMRFHLKNGAIGKVVSSRSRELGQRLTLVGSEGYLQIGLWGVGLRMRSERGKAFEQNEYLELALSRRPPADTSFVDQLRNLVQAIEGKEELVVNGEEGMAAVEVVCGAYSNALPEPHVQVAARGERK